MPTLLELCEAQAQKEGCTVSELKVLTLDSRVSSPTVAGLETCTALEELSLNKCGIKSLVGFPMLPVLKVLRLSDNLIADGLGALADAELQNLQELDLSGNKIANLDELEPLAAIASLASLDLYQCPVTQLEGYAKKVFGIMENLSFLDGLDSEGQEREFEGGDDDDDDEEDEEEEEGGSDEESEEEGPAAPAGGFQGDEGDSEDGSEQDSEDEGVQVLQTAGNQLSDEDDSDDEPVELGTEMLLQAPTAEESDDGSFDEDGEDEEDVDEEDDEEDDEAEAGPSKRRKVEEEEAGTDEEEDDDE